MSVEDEVKKNLENMGIDATKAVEKLGDTEKVEIDETIETPEEATEGEYTEFEKEQMEKGWNPDGPKSAEEYSRSQPLYDEIKARGKQIKQMQKTLDSLTEHMSKQEKLAYEKALETLRQEKEEAIQRGDVHGVMDVEQRQNNMLAEAKEQKQEVIPEAEAFAEKYEHIFKSADFDEVEITKFVMERDSELMAKNLSPKQHMELLESHMLKKFPNYFGNGKETVTRGNQSVESGNGSNVVGKSSKSKYTFHDLNPEQRRVARDFEKYGIMKVGAYIKQLVELGDLK